MRTSAALAILVAGLASVAVVAIGTAHADRKLPSVEGSAPQPIAEVLKSGSGTVVGSVTERGANWLTIDDGSAQVDVTTGHFLPEGIRKDEQITVIGRVWRGGLMANEIILADGSSHGPAGYAARTARSDDLDDED